MFKSGVYSITHIESGRQYIGSSIDICARWRCHVRMLKNGTHHTKKLLRVWAKYDEAAFRFDVLEYVPDREMLIVREQHHMDTLKPWYNTQPCAASCLGIKRSKDFCAKVSKAKTGFRHSEETKKKLSALRSLPENREIARRQVIAWLSNVSDEEKAARMRKARAARSGAIYHASDETRRKLSAALRGRKPSDHCLEAAAKKNTGRPRSEETRRKMSDSGKGRVVSEETRQKMSVARAGRKLSEEQRRRISEGMTGRKRGPYKPRGIIETGLKFLAE